MAPFSTVMAIEKEIPEIDTIVNHACDDDSYSLYLQFVLHVRNVVGIQPLLYEQAFSSQLPIEWKEVLLELVGP